MKLANIGRFFDGFVERFVGNDRARLDFLDRHNNCSIFNCGGWHYHDHANGMALVKCDTVREAIDKARQQFDEHDYV